MSILIKSFVSLENCWKKIIHSRLYNYLEENKLLSENQYGFRKDQSTGLAIFDVLKVLHENWNEGMYSGCVSIYFSRAFDSIDHSILAEALGMYGLDSYIYHVINN